MARFKAPRVEKLGSTIITNDAGGQAFSRSPRVELVSMLLASYLNGTTYKSAAEEYARVRGCVRALAERGDLLFGAKAALFARREYGMRTASHAAAVQVAIERSEHPEQRGEWGPVFYDRIVDRLDDMLEIAGHWLTLRGSRRKTLPHAMKLGFARVLERAPAHLLAKWDGSATRSLTLRQLAHLVHPKKGERGSVVWRLRGGKLAAADTHEVAMSRAGEAGVGLEGSERVQAVEEAKGAEWRRLLQEDRLKYLAALRNARNILRDAPDCASLLADKLTNRRDIRFSKVFPYQIFLAGRELSVDPNLPRAELKVVLTALAHALDLALANVPPLPGRTLLAVDDSGSMGPPCGSTLFQDAALFAAAIIRRNPEVDFMLWGDRARFVPLAHLGELGTFVLADYLTSKMEWGGTDMGSIFETAREAYDRVIILTDGQSWAGVLGTVALGRYEKRTNSRPYVYLWDLTGDRSAQFDEHRYCKLFGRSDRVFEIFGKVEEDRDEIIRRIEAVVL